LKINHAVKIAFERISDNVFIFLKHVIVMIVRGTYTEVIRNHRNVF